VCEAPPGEICSALGVLPAICIFKGLFSGEIRICPGGKNPTVEHAPSKPFNVQRVVQTFLAAVTPCAAFISAPLAKDAENPK
jgi:hypothetical protein